MRDLTNDECEAIAHQIFDVLDDNSVRRGDRISILMACVTAHIQEAPQAVRRGITDMIKEGLEHSLKGWPRD